MTRINWLSWGKAAFEKSIQEGKPILLDISATWCHWCHVMEDETYARNEVIKVIGENFIPIRVDTDERPDVNERYNQGSWPSTVFLTPAGEIITGTTYAGPEEFVELSHQVLEIFRHRGGLIGSNPLLRGSNLFTPKEIKGSALTEDLPLEEKRTHFIKYREILLRKFEQILYGNFDPLYGGFRPPAGGDGPKFPQIEALEYCLAKCRPDGDRRFRQVLAKSLEGMSEGGLFDHLEGGFFRYATDSAWQNPHYEKLLADNARLAKLYFDSYRLLGDRSFLETSQRTVSFIKNWLYDFDRGGFYASVAADEEYYNRASRTERLAYREENNKPTVDETIYTNLNCWAVESLFSIGEKEMSTKSFQKIFRESRSPNGLFCHFVRGGQGFLPELLSDQIAVSKAWLSHPDPGSRYDDGGLPGPIREVLGDEAVTARSFWNVVMENFYDKERGGFWDRVPVEDEEFGLLKVPRKDLDENVEAIRILEDLGQAEEAKKSLIEIFCLYQRPSIHSGSLAKILLNA